MSTSQSFLPWRKKLKEKIMSSTMCCGRFTKECDQLKYVLERTIKHGESDSVLLIGFKGSGKTTILNHSLNTIRQSGHDDFTIVHLNGLIHTDDGLALKEIICQLHLKELEGDRVAGSFSDNLLFLLQSLRTGDRNTSKPVKLGLRSPLPLNLGTNSLKVTSEPPPMAGQADNSFSERQTESHGPGLPQNPASSGLGRQITV
ncbi:origin recognition complex subunit 4 [Homalodisca vitripennis]|nr:origin recognition complex subunit 4 [Homalodisca vitripennis]